MEIRKGERLPMNWGGDPMDIESEVIGFGYNTRTCEDIIICRAYDKAVDRYCYAKGTLPQISYDHTKLYWAEGEYAVNDIGDKSIPEGFEPDRRESISVPGELVRQENKVINAAEQKADAVASLFCKDIEDNVKDDADVFALSSQSSKEMPSESKKSLVLKSSFAKRYREVFLMLCAYMDGVGLSDEDAEDVLDHLMNDDE